MSLGSRDNAQHDLARSCKLAPIFVQIGREFWGLGIATAAVSLLVKTESRRPLAARVAKHNLGSIRVLEKVGFSRTGEDALTLSNGTRQEEFLYVLKV